MDSTHQDEEKIGRAYRRCWQPIAGAAMLLVVTAYFLDVKWVVAAGFLVVIGFLSDIDARLFDSITRTRRVTVLLDDLKGAHDNE